MYPLKRQQRPLQPYLSPLLFRLVTLVLLAITGWSFWQASSAQSTGLSFGGGRGVQVVDPSGNNRMPFWNVQSNITVDFALYPLQTSDFIKRFVNYQPYYGQPIDLTGLSSSLTWQQSYTTTNPYESSSVTLPNNAPAGLYAIKASHASAGTDNEYLLVSHTALMLKRAAGGQVIAWATDLHTQTPVSGMSVTLYDKQAVSVAQATTDANGIARFSIGNAAAFMAIGQKANELSVTGMDWQWQSDQGYWYWDWGSGDPSQDAYRLYLHTDRPLYRPGQKIYYQGMVRKIENGGYTMISAGDVISLTLRDSRNNQVASQNVAADSFGTVSGEFVLASEPPLGRYLLEMKVGTQTLRQELKVEEFSKPEYQVNVTTPKSYIISGDSSEITVDAQYFFGKPVANAQVRLRIYRYPFWRYGWYWWYYAPPPAYGTQPEGELTGTTGADGKWTTSYKPTVNDEWDALYTFEATVTDARNQPVTGSGQLSVRWNSFDLNLTMDKYGYRSDESVNVQLLAQRPDNTAVANKSINVRILRDYWDTTPETDAVPPQTVTTGADGKAQVIFTNVPQGWYRIEATTTDERGRKVLANNYLWVYNLNANDWWYFDNSELSILTDKESYAPGDTAQLLIQSRVKGLALLTLEREGVLSEQIVNINGPVTTVNVPISANQAPNVYARIHLFKPTDSTERGELREGRLLIAQRNLAVPAADKKLDITITADAASYKPGSQATLTLQVSNNNQPVQARVALALVDEALFAVQSDLSADLFSTFWGQRMASVSTYDNLVRRPYYYPVAMEGPVPTGQPTGTPAPAQPVTDNAGSSSTYLRRRFEDTAYWNATITTDANGKATVTLTLPDNLTTWRVIARAITIDSKVGEGKGSVLVTQEMIARPALPRFAVVGDRVQVGAVAQNFSGADTTGSLDLASNNLTLLDGVARTINLTNNGSARSDWTAVASSPGTGLVTTTLQSGRGNDAVELPMWVKPFAIPDRWLAAGQANLVASESFSLPLNAITSGSKFTLRLSPSLALGVLDGLDELIDYPYGCVEQTMSRLLPSAAAAKVYADLGLPNPKTGEIPQIISEGLQKVYGFQHADGGWGWFYDDKNGTYLTAYVLFGLHSVKQAGFTVDAQVITRGLDFLENTRTSVSDPQIQTYVLYVLALFERNHLAETQALLAQANKLDAATLATLALTLQKQGDSTNAQAVVDQLIARAVTSGNGVYWPLPTSNNYDWWMWQTMASTEKNTAVAVRALAALRPNHEMLPKAVRWLLEHRRGAGWNNTQATAQAVLGLLDVIKATGELQSSYSYNVTLNGQPLASGQVTPQEATKPITPLVVSGERLRAGNNELRIERTAGNGSLYYSALLDQQLFYDQFTAVASRDQGLSMERSYRLVEGKANADGSYNVGDVVEVTLKLKNPGELWYVLLQDPVPAGFEVVQERMNANIYWGYDYMPFFWESWGYNRKEIRTDRVEYFITQLWPGEHTFTYLMRAAIPGEFSVLPGVASPMYNESIWGRTASQQVKIEPQKLAARPTLAGDLDRSCRLTATDTRLAIDGWNSNNLSRDVVADGILDLRDVAAVGSRIGASCADARSLPGTGNDRVNFTVAMQNGTISVAGEFSVTISLNTLEQAGVEIGSVETGSINASSVDANNLGGFSLALNFDANRAYVKRVVWNPALGDSLPMGPRILNGKVAVGAYNLPALSAGSQLITVVFAGSGVGNGTIGVAQSEAVDAQGRAIAAVSTGGGSVTVEGKSLYMPVAGR